MVIKKGLVFIFCTIFFTFSVFASIGVSPAYHEIEFSPNAKYVLTFNFFTDGDSKLRLYTAGDLTEYAELSKKSLKGSGSVNVLLTLPDEIKVPGTHRLLIGAEQVVEEGTGVAIVGNMRAVIRINVPYPGKYAEVEFEAKNANAGQPVDFHVKINNLGKEYLVVKANIEIYDSTGKKLDTLPGGSFLIESSASKEFTTQLDTKDYKAGNYKAVAVVEYDESSIREEKTFRLGELFVDIANYTSEVERDKINPFIIEAESFWNDPIENVYANVSIIDHDIRFLTPSSNIEPFGKATLRGYLDTSTIEGDTFKAKIILNYKGNSTERTVDVRFKKDINYLVYIIIAVVAITVIGWFIWKRRKKKK